MVIGTIANGMLECIKAFLLNYTDDKTKKQIATIKIDNNASKDRPEIFIINNDKKQKAQPKVKEVKEDNEYFEKLQFILRKEYCEETSYRLMFIIGVTELYLIITMGIYPFIATDNLYQSWFEKIIGSFTDAAFDLFFLLNFVLAVNRLCTILKLYLTILQNARKFLNNHNNSANAAQKNQEIRILIQSFIQFLVFIAPTIYGFMPRYGGMTSLEHELLNTASILFCGISPILYLILLRKFRYHVLSSLRIVPKQNLTMVQPMKTHVHQQSKMAMNT
uniref:G-protein coupled receptors family 1 profile domain-containing protein n=1 Tax=Meloidogyne floridensis TaxID=298350 RepID=A0A915P4B3_9BILA